jgi:hypothetical protein
VATWAEVVSLVEAFATAEGVPKNDALYRALANRAIGIISTRVGHFEKHWNNLSTDTTYGTLTLSTRYVTFPSDLVDVTSVYWDELKIDEAPSESWLDEYDSLWRSTDGGPTMFLRTGTGLTLNRAPTGTVDGYLVIWGTGCIPLFAEGATIDPLDYIPDPHGLLIADYMTGFMPIDFRDKSDAQVAAMRVIREEKKASWREGLDLCVSDIMKRKLPAQTGS